MERVLEKIGNPFGRFLTSRRAPAWMTGRIQHWTERGLIRTVRIARRFTGADTIRGRFDRYGIKIRDLRDARSLPLEELDRVADSYKLGGAVLLGTEGAVLGAATTVACTVPGSPVLVPSLIALDVTSSLTLLSRHACRIGSTYDFSPQDPNTLPHLIGAMAPRLRTSDEGYVAVKTAAIKAIQDAGRFFARTSLRIDRRVLEAEAPQLIRLISYVARRLGVVLTEKNLAVLIPIAGAALNSTVNVAFQRVGHSLAQDYFRRMILDERYGANIVESALNQEVAGLRSSPSHAVPH